MVINETKQDFFFWYTPVIIARGDTNYVVLSRHVPDHATPPKHAAPQNTLPP